jgi:hypothetical protein
MLELVVLIFVVCHKDTSENLILRGLREANCLNPLWRHDFLFAKLLLCAMGYATILNVVPGDWLYLFISSS